MDRDDFVSEVRRLVARWAEENLGGEPDWGPLEAALPMEWCGGFMWMTRAQQDDAVIEVYKHGITRRTLHLDHQGQAYRYRGDRYVKVALDRAIDDVFEGLEEMGWSRTTKYDAAFIRAKHQALRERGWTVISTADGQDSAQRDQG